MMQNQPGGFSWAFKRSFHFGSNGSMAQVIKSLMLLGDEGFSSSPNNEIVIEPQGEDYTFCYRIQHRNKNRLYTTAFSEGRIWQAQDGHIIVEGHAQIEPMTACFSIGFYMFLAFLCLPFAESFYIFLPLIFAGLVAYEIFRAYNDYNQALYGVAEAVANTHNMPENLRSEKEPQISRNKNVKNTVLNDRAALRPDSIWNEAISEYDDQYQ